MCKIQQVINSGLDHLLQPNKIQAVPPVFLSFQVQFLHYITQTPMEGGLSEFTDGFTAAKQLREENPEAFRMLLETPVDYIDVGSDHYGEFFKLYPPYTLT